MMTATIISLGLHYTIIYIPFWVRVRHQYMRRYMGDGGWYQHGWDVHGVLTQEREPRTRLNSLLTMCVLPSVRIDHQTELSPNIVCVLAKVRTESYQIMAGNLTPQFWERKLGKSSICGAREIWNCPACTKKVSVSLSWSRVSDKVDLPGAQG